MKKNKGFTLIELLVVIAIIGVLASIVLASLNTARVKGADAAIKSNLTNTRAQASIFYDTNTVALNTYSSVCAIGPIGGANTINAGVQAASTVSGTGTVVLGTNNTVGALQTSSTANCNDNATAWAAEVKLKSNTSDYFCVDSLGTAKVTTTPLAVTSVGGSTGLSCI